MNAAASLDLFELDALAIGPDEHFDTAHGQHAADVAYLAIHIRDKPHERTMPASETRFVMGLAPEMSGLDFYFSQSGFHRRRVLGQIAALPALWVDLDYYKDPRLQRAMPLELLSMAQSKYPALPMPTLVISSGRGAYFDWVFKQPLKPADLAQWQYTMDGLIAIFKSFGADPSCRDATRVLRIVGGTNQKNQREVTGYKTGSLVEFDEIRRAVLEYAGTVKAIETPETAQNREADAKPKSADAKTPMPELLVHAGQNAKPTQNPAKQESSARRPLTEKQKKALLGPYRLHQARLSDYETLAKLRGGKLEDCRSRMLFAVASSLAWFVGDEKRLKVELQNFVQEHFKNPRKYGPSRIKAVIERLKLDQEGVVVSIWEGQRAPNRYRMTNEYLLELLEISQDEEKKLSTIISKQEKARRRREKDGTTSREEFEAPAKERREKIKKLSAKGISQAEIAKQLRTDKRRVSETLQQARPPEYKERTPDSGTANASIGVSFVSIGVSFDEEQLRRVLELRDTGLSIRAISAALGLSKSQAHRLIQQVSESAERKD